MVLHPGDTTDSCNNNGSFCRFEHRYLALVCSEGYWNAVKTVLLAGFCQQAMSGMRRRPNIDHGNNAFDSGVAVYLAEI